MLLPKEGALHATSARSIGAVRVASYHSSLSQRPVRPAWHRDRAKRNLLLPGTIVNRTYGTHKTLYTYLFLLTIFGPIYYGPP